MHTHYPNTPAGGPPATDRQPSKPTRRQRNTTHRLARTALFAAVRGLAYTLGATVPPVIWWWITTR